MRNFNSKATTEEPFIFCTEERNIKSMELVSPGRIDDNLSYHEIIFKKCCTVNHDNNDNELFAEGREERTDDFVL